MKKHLLSIAAVVIVAFTTFGQTNEEKALALIDAFETGDQAALDYVGTTYINHNLSVPSGPEVLQGFITGTPSGVTTETPRSFEIGDYVITHTVYGGVWNGGVPQVGFDVFRFEDGVIVEHWDNLSEVVDDMDGTSQTDGAVTPATNLDETDSNDTLLEEMAQTLFVDGDWTDVGVYFNLDEYIQHSVGSGPDGAFLETLEGQTGLSFYDDVKFIHTLGNFGLVMSEGPDITGVDTEGLYAYYDLFRMENNQIIEHWDVIQLIPAEEDWANNNGKWGDDALIASVPEELTIVEDGIYPEDIVIANSKVYVSGLGDGTIVSFDLAQDLVDSQPFAAAQDGFAQSWGLASDGSVLLNILNNPNFADLTDNGPSKLVEYDILTGEMNNEWDLPTSTISNSVQIIDGKYYVCEWAPTPRIYEIDPATNTINENWFTSTEWDASISGLGGVIYNGTDAFYLSQGNELWYLPITNGTPGTLEQVTTDGIDIVDADGITWGDGKVYYATNDAGDPADLGTVYEVEFTDAITGTVSVVIEGLDDTSGVWYLEEDDEEYLFINVSQMGVIFGLDEFDSPFTIEIITLEEDIIDFVNEVNAEQNIVVAPNPFSNETSIQISIAAQGEYQLEVYDMQGKKVVSEQYQFNSGMNMIPFSAEKLNGGLYSFVISNGSIAKTGKMLVNKQ